MVFSGVFGVMCFFPLCVYPFRPGGCSVWFAGWMSRVSAMRLHIPSIYCVQPHGRDSGNPSRKSYRATSRAKWINIQRGKAHHTKHTTKHYKCTLMLNPPALQNNTTNVVIQQNSRKLLMMDILMSETCWAHKKWNKLASDIKLVFYASTITMMHGPINIRLKKIYNLFLSWNHVSFNWPLSDNLYKTQNMVHTFASTIYVIWDPIKLTKCIKIALYVKTSHFMLLYYSL